MLLSRKGGPDERHNSGALWGMKDLWFLTESQEKLLTLVKQIVNTFFKIKSITDDCTQKILLATFLTQKVQDIKEKLSSQHF